MVRRACQVVFDQGTIAGKQMPAKKQGVRKTHLKNRFHIRAIVGELQSSGVGQNLARGHSDPSGSLLECWDTGLKVEFTKL